MFKTIKSYINRIRVLKPNETVVDGSELIALRLKKEATPLTKAELTLLQLGSYIPSFKGLVGKTDEFKMGMAAFCKQTADSDYWKFLMIHLKQDQVNNSLFNSEVPPSDDFMRGSINGIWIVDEQIKLLGSSKENEKKKPEEPKS